MNWKHAGLFLLASLPLFAAGNGLRGEYYNNTGLAGTPAAVRTDPTINFEWWGTPVNGLSNNYFSARWSGKVEAPVTGAYKLATYSNAGIRVWLDGSLVIDNWTSHWTARDASASLNLVAGQQYTLKVEYHESEGSAVAKLLWSYPGQAEAVIPQTRLYSDAVAPAIPPTYLSEMNPVFSANGWGRYERDRSNGESRPRDGDTIEINSVRYGRGLGVHALSDLRYQLFGKFKSFLADVGVDDEVESGGSAIFEVWMDGAKKYTSPVRKGSDPAITVALDVTGVNELKLIVLDAGDGTTRDHADWAGARVSLSPLVAPGPNPPPTPQPPSTPTGLTATPGNTRVALAWNASSGATSYALYRGTVSGGGAAYAMNLMSPSFVDTNVTNGTMYYYRVLAMNGTLASPPSPQVSAMPQGTDSTPPPVVPTGLSATPGNGQVSLAWNAVSGAAGYRLFRSTISGMTGDQVASGAATNFLNTGLTNGTTYYYRVAAFNANGSSEPSAPVSATPVAPAPPPPAPAPATPSGLAAMPGNAQVTVTWGAVSGATGYTLFRTTTAGAQGDAMPMGAATNFINTGLVNGTTYYYRVAASNANGSSAPSAQVSAKPSAPAVPPAPSGLSAAPGNAEVTLTWQLSDMVASYNVYRGTSSNGQGATPIATGITLGTFKNTGLTNGTTYFYKIAGVNANGVGERSAEVSAKPVAPVLPPAPTGLAATPGNTEVTLTWVATEGATSYHLYRSTVSGGQGDTPVISGITGLTIKDTGLTNGTTYYYKVAGVSANGVGLKSAQVSARPAPPPVPGVPTGFTATPGNAQVTLNWAALTGATSYNVYRGTTSSGQGDVPLAAGITVLTWVDTTAVNGTTYFYKLAGVNATGIGARTAAVSASPSAPATVLTPAQMSAFRFLRQSTWGPTPALMDRVVQIGKSAFLDEQFALPATPYTQALEDTPNMELVSEQFFKNALSGPDQLRQRVAWALSQIWVVSAVKVDNTHAMVPYIRILEEGAFGNVRAVLEQITLSPAMGEFLDMVNNRKAFGTAPNIVMPNENFARELMQLFTIGLTGLGPDGTPNTTPSYNQSDILELSRVLTGWTYGDAVAGDPTRINPRYYAGPMEPVAAFHDTGAKTVFVGTPQQTVFAPNQTARQDLAQALDMLVNHPNMGPFLSRQLIQKLVKSSPSPAYIGRVAAVFANNGQGVRGDLRAIVRAVLLDPEADANPHSGKFSEPALFLTTLARGLNSTVVDHPYITDFSQDMSQRIWFAPSVFSYFSPGYRLNGVLAPEFQIWSTATAMTRTNFVAALISGGFGSNFTIDITPYTPVAGNPAALVDTANALLMGGTMGPEMRQAILTALASATTNTERIRTVLYLVASSMQYQVEH